ncbi:tetratricopeptide repeat-containing sulfotransferase family protein [Pseudoalteromonas sp. GB56]
MQVDNDGQYNEDLNRVWQLINQRQFRQAQPHCSSLSKQFPHQVQSWFVSSFLAMQQGRFICALEAIDKAMLMEPSEPRWRMHKVRCLILSGNKQQAKKVLKSVELSADAGYAKHGEVAMLANQLGLYTLAKAHYLLAIDSSDANDHLGTLYFNLASVERYLGELLQATEHLDKALAINPKDSEALLLRSSIKKQTPDDNHIEQLQSLLKVESLPPIAKAQLNYALAKEFEDIEQYAHSADCVKHGADIRRAHMRYSVSGDVRTLNTLTSVFNHRLISSKSPACDSDRPIFILGLPRTGSTLVERVLTQHHDIESAGELNHFARAMTQMIRADNPQPQLSKPDLVKRSAQLDFKELGERYLTCLNDENPDARFVIDKLPLNSLYTGLIHKALPNAKIIYVQRHPMATCYAMYKQLFTHGYPFSYNLDELAQYYIAHQKMMVQFQQSLGCAMFTLQYEDLVDDFAPSVGALAHYCNIEVTPHMLKFEANKAASTTASASQVRQGLYSTSRDQWRNYESLLAPLKQQLTKAGIACD